jgi:uncharacterized protein (TIGR03435 family)
MTVQCMFWFHPLVWWLGARLVDLREQSCDEQVVLAGSEPSVYATSILKTCRFCLESPLACVAGATSSNLAARIDTIMRAAAPDDVRAWQRGLMVAAAAAVVAGPVLVGLLTPAPLQAQARAAAPPRLSASSTRPARMAFLQDTAVTAGGQTFEVASVKPNTSGDLRVMFGMRPGGRFTATNVPLRELIRMAYGLQNFQIQGGPDWLGSERFDVVAKAEGDLPPMAPGGPPNPLLLMVQSLLQERFKLTVHRETKEMPIYALVIARSDKRLGPQLRPSETDCAALMAARGAAGGPPPPPPIKPGERPQCGMFMGMARIAAGGVPTLQLAMSLSQRVGRIVVDRTGLAGMYDFEVDFTPDQLPQGPPPPGAPPLPPIDPNGPSLFTALQEQLGLKLDSDRGPVEVLIIDSVERPTPD